MLYFYRKTYYISFRLASRKNMFILNDILLILANPLIGNANNQIRSQLCEIVQA